MATPKRRPVAERMRPLAPPPREAVNDHEALWGVIEKLEHLPERVANLEGKMSTLQKLVIGTFLAILSVGLINLLR